MKNDRQFDDRLSLVGDESRAWNPLLTSLLVLSEKLEELGIVYADGQAIYIEPEVVEAKL